MKGITEKQKNILDYIREFIKTHDYSPSLEEIKTHFDYRSLATVHQHLTALKRKGHILSDKQSARSLNLSHQPSQIVKVPIVGTFASSHPIEFFSKISQTLEFPISQIPHPDKSYILQVRGEGLSHELISNLDMLLIEATTQLSLKQVGIFTLPGGSTLLRRYFPEDQFVRLEPLSLNTYTPTEVFRPHEITIQGRLLSLIRSY